MESSASCRSKPENEELKLDELVTELQALKKLYELLQKNSNGAARPDQPTAHLLDEKSSHMLKKLLDDATHHVLDSQAKIISCTPEKPKPDITSCTPEIKIQESEDGPNSNPNEIQKSQECHSVLPVKILPEASIFSPMAEPKIVLTPSPISVPPRVSKPRAKPSNNRRGNHSYRSIMNRPSESGNTTNSSQPSKNRNEIQKSTECHYFAPDNNLPKAAISSPMAEQKIFQSSSPNSVPARVSKSRSDHRIMNRPSELGIIAKPSQPSKNPTQRKKPVSSGSCNSHRRSSRHGEVLAVIPAQKRQRVEPAKHLSRISSRVSNRSLKPDRSNHELSKNRQSKSTSIVGDRTTQVVRRNDRVAESKSKVTDNHSKPGRLNRSNGRRYLSSSSESSRSNSGSTSSSWPTPLTPRKPTARISRKNDQIVESKREATKEKRTSRSNYGSSCSRKKQSRLKTKRKPPPPQPAAKIQSSVPPQRHHLSLIPRWTAPKVKRDSKEEKQGRFRRLTNKLAVIFHHHHHHHHHLLVGEGEEKGREEVSRSLWKHLKAVLHLGGKTRKRVATNGREHGHLRVMIEGILHHLWGMRLRRRRPEGRMRGRRVSKRHRLWAWFRRRGGVAVGGRRRLRLRPNVSGRQLAKGRG